MANTLHTFNCADIIVVRATIRLRLGGLLVAAANVELLLDPVHYGGLVLNWLSLLVVLFGRKEATLDKSW